MYNDKLMKVNSDFIAGGMNQGKNEWMNERMT